MNNINAATDLASNVDSHSHAPGHIDVDEKFVSRDWLLVVTPNPGGSEPDIVLHESFSGVPGRRIKHIHLTFEKPDAIFSANIKIVSDEEYIFHAHNPVNLTGEAVDVALIQLSEHRRELCVCFKSEIEQDAKMTFNVVKPHLPTVFVSVDPSVAIRRKNG